MTRVLIIDDHAVVREILRGQLTRARIDVVGEAADLDDGLRQAQRLRPEIIILDSVLPRTSGPAALAALTSSLPDARIVYLGNDADPRYADAALRAGAGAFVFKDDADTTIVPTVQALATERTVPRAGRGRRSPGTGSVPWRRTLAVTGPSRSTASRDAVLHARSRVADPGRMRSSATLTPCVAASPQGAKRGRRSAHGRRIGSTTIVVNAEPPARLLDRRR